MPEVSDARLWSLYRGGLASFLVAKRLRFSDEVETLIRQCGEDAAASAFELRGERYGGPLNNTTAPRLHLDMFHQRMADAGVKVVGDVSYFLKVYNHYMMLLTVRYQRYTGDEVAGTPGANSWHDFHGEKWPVKPYGTLEQRLHAARQHAHWETFLKDF